ncbi:MAG: hypothetical protein P8N98_13840, partial [Paracoccaceae bacterium]|nr:hypothetical protein [Paracoccaceae bacterium]
MKLAAAQVSCGDKNDHRWSAAYPRGGNSSRLNCGPEIFRVAFLCSTHSTMRMPTMQNRMHYQQNKKPGQKARVLNGTSAPARTGGL